MGYIVDPSVFFRDEPAQKILQTMNPTEAVLQSLREAKTSLEIKYLEGMVSRRVKTLENTVRLVEAKWMKNKTDREYVQQIRSEIDRLQDQMEKTRARLLSRG